MNPWTFETWWGEVERVAWTLWPYGMDRDEIRRREPWFAFVEDHELARRWHDLPLWIPQSARIHERMPLWILDHLAAVDVPFESADRYGFCFRSGSNTPPRVNDIHRPLSPIQGLSVPSNGIPTALRLRSLAS